MTRIFLWLLTLLPLAKRCSACREAVVWGRRRASGDQKRLRWRWLLLSLLLLSLWGRRQASGGQKRLPGDDGQLKDIVVWKVAQYQKLFLKSKWKPDYDWTVASLWKKFGEKRHVVSVSCCYLPLLSLSTTTALLLETSWACMLAAWYTVNRLIFS